MDNDYPDTGDMDKRQRERYLLSVNLLNGAYHDEMRLQRREVSVAVEPRSIPCDGPGCQKQYAGNLWPPKSWVRLVNRDGPIGEFCSRGCLGGWIMQEWKQEHGSEETLRASTSPT